MDTALYTPYSREEIDLTLTVLATNGGNITRTLSILRGHDKDVFGKLTKDTVLDWKNELHHHRYCELQDEYADSIARRAAARSMEIAELASAGVESFVQKAIDGAATITPATPADVRDLATSARNLSQVQVNSIEKARLLRDQPTEVHSLESLEELVGVLQAAGVVKNATIDGEAVEETPAELTP